MGGFVDRPVAGPGSQSLGQLLYASGRYGWLPGISQYAPAAPATAPSTSPATSPGTSSPSSANPALTTEAQPRSASGPGNALAASTQSAPGAQPNTTFKTLLGQ